MDMQQSDSCAKHAPRAEAMQHFFQNLNSLRHMYPYSVFPCSRWCPECFTLLPPGQSCPDRHWDYNEASKQFIDGHLQFLVNWNATRAFNGNFYVFNSGSHINKRLTCSDLVIDLVSGVFCIIYGDGTFFSFLLISDYEPGERCIDYVYMPHMRMRGFQNRLIFEQETKFNTHGGRMCLVQKSRFDRSFLGFFLFCISRDDQNKVIVTLLYPPRVLLVSQVDISIRALAFHPDINGTPALLATTDADIYYVPLEIKKHESEFIFRAPGEIKNQESELQPFIRQDFRSLEHCLNAQFTRLPFDEFASHFGRIDDIVVFGLKNDILIYDSHRGVIFWVSSTDFTGAVVIAFVPKLVAPDRDSKHYGRLLVLTGTNVLLVCDQSSCIYALDLRMTELFLNTGLSSLSTQAILTRRRDAVFTVGTSFTSSASSPDAPVLPWCEPILYVFPHKLNCRTVLNNTPAGHLSVYIKDTGKKTH